MYSSPKGLLVVGEAGGVEVDALRLEDEARWCEAFKYASERPVEEDLSMFNAVSMECLTWRRLRGGGGVDGSSSAIIELWYLPEEYSRSLKSLSLFNSQL